MSNPALADVICEKIGEDWVTNLGELAKLKAHAGNKQFMDAIRRVKQVGMSIQ